ncbi:MAG: hypothetical protein C0179_03515 [Fervidicoccus sp.]|nr:MAG: hypothetical protein C0179_03515 [Fervidicoccus sp.]
MGEDEVIDFGSHKMLKTYARVFNIEYRKIPGELIETPPLDTIEFIASREPNYSTSTKYVFIQLNPFKEEQVESVVKEIERGVMNRKIYYLVEVYGESPFVLVGRTSAVPVRFEPWFATEYFERFPQEKELFWGIAIVSTRIDMRYLWRQAYLMRTYYVKVDIDEDELGDLVKLIKGVRSWEELMERVRNG